MNGAITSSGVSAFISGKMEISMKVNGYVHSKTVKVQITSLTTTSIMDITKKVNLMAMASTSGNQVPFMLVISNKA